MACSEDDIRYFGPDLPQLCKERLIADEEGFFHCHYRYRPYPSKHVSIRTTDDETYHVIDTTDGRHKILEEIEWARAIFELYEGAIFMHQGQSYLVKEISHDRKLAKLEKSNVEWTTRQRDFTWVAWSIQNEEMRLISGNVDWTETSTPSRHCASERSMGRPCQRTMVGSRVRAGPESPMRHNTDVAIPLRSHDHRLWLLQGRQAQQHSRRC